MNDQFLKDYRITPRQAFAQDLSKRLKINKEVTIMAKKAGLRPVGLVAIVMLVILTLTSIVSPVVRAKVQHWVGQIGGVLFTETWDYPSSSTSAAVAPSEVMNIEDARALLPFIIDLPTWIPEGYSSDGKVTFVHFEDGVERIFLHWHAPQKAQLEIEIENLLPEKSHWLIGLESVEEVLVNGEKVALVRGGWQSETKVWENRGQIHLYVPHKGQTYIFSSNEKDISVDKLISIAESLP